MLAALLLASCSAANPIARSGPAIGSAIGYVAGDEPRAVEIARGILAQGGSVADAGVALAFALTVTLPSRASLGGGGACLVHRGREPTPDGIFFSSQLTIQQPTPTESVAFLPAAGGPAASVGLPAMVRGLFAIQAKYGTLHWGQVVAPAENLARFGAPVARAFMRDIAAAHAELTGPDGRPLAEGQTIPQGELASTFAMLRTQGAAALYLGDLAKDYVAGTGGAVDPATLRAVVPVWSEPEGIESGNDRAYFTATPGGVLAQSIWTKVNGGSAGGTGSLLTRLLPGGGSRAAAAPGQQALAIVDAAAALVPAAGAAANPSGIAGGDAATGFVIADYKGNALACSLTMGRLFGTGKLVGHTGIIGSLPVPGPASDGLSTAALILANDNSHKLLGAFAGGGDRSGGESLAEVSLDAAGGGGSLDRAIAQPRVFAAGNGPALAEPGAVLGQRAAVESAALGAVNAVLCPGGLPGSDPKCSVATDPRGAGVTAVASRRR